MRNPSVLCLLKITYDQSNKRFRHKQEIFAFFIKKYKRIAFAIKNKIYINLPRLNDTT